MIEDHSHLPPAVPPIVREPLRLGQLAIPSRFFLAPLAGYTSLAFRLAVRECGGLGLATTDLVNARSLIEGRRRAFELAETCEQDRPLSIQIYGTVIAEMEQAARVVVGAGGLGRRHQHGLPGPKGGQERRRLGAHVPGGPGRRSRRGGRQCGETSR